MTTAFYQIFVRSFADFNQDGIGDLQGIIHKLDYLAYLGVEGIWLSPIFRSPSYHKYDVTNYYEIDPEYGTMQDFEELVEKAAVYRIKIILDLVISHTSSQHPWFLASAKKQAHYRDYYIWQSPKVIKNLGLETRSATEDTSIKKPWYKEPENSEKYYGIFSKNMPDLNLDNQNTRIEILEIARFWMRKGVYGFRLDAAKHLYPDWLPAEKNIIFWKALQDELKKEFGFVYLVGEVWSEPEKVAPFFEGLNANFNFELCYDIRDIILEEEDSKDLIQKLLKSYKIYATANPDFIDATFLSNHDQQRIASTFKGNLLKLKAAANLLFTLSGQPFIYYGEELGTKGQKPDLHLREPYLWNYLENDYFRTNWIKAKYSNEKRLTPLSEQSADPESLFNHYRNLLHLRKKHAALRQVSPANLQSFLLEDKGIISFIRTNPAENLLILQNLTRVTKELDLPVSIEKAVYSTQKSNHTKQKATLGPMGLLVLALNNTGYYG